MSAEELGAKLVSYDVVTEAHNNAIATAMNSRNTLVCNLVEDILDSKTLHAYKVPLCFREVDDDLAVSHDEVETPLD